MGVASVSKWRDLVGGCLPRTVLPGGLKMGHVRKCFKDEFTGKGGRYQIKNGKRIRIEEPTKTQEEARKEAESKSTASASQTEKSKE